MDVCVQLHTGVTQLNVTHTLTLSLHLWPDEGRCVAHGVAPASVVDVSRILINFPLRRLCK